MSRTSNTCSKERRAATWSTITSAGFRRAPPQRYPLDLGLAEQSIESYAAIALIDAEGAAFGWIGVMSRRPMADAALVRSTLLIVAGRTSAELQRQQAEIALERAHADLAAHAERGEELERINAELQREIAERRHCRETDDARRHARRRDRPPQPHRSS